MEKTEVIIIGGGLAGLTAAIHLAKKGILTTLFERNQFPHHKVCGEYLSKEVLPYFDELEIPIRSLQPVEISRLFFSTSNGNSIETRLPQGGIGISRYALDNLLYVKALEVGVQVLQVSVSAIAFENDRFEVVADDKKYRSRFILAAYGKRSGLDKNLDRPFFKNLSPWLAVKAHYMNPAFPQDLVALHNFRGGYCGLSKTESGAVNVCYLATYKSFKSYKNPAAFEQEILQQNPFLKDFFREATSVFEQRLSIGQVSFERKERVKDHILFIGDAAGLIHPLCGNGMAMAIKSAKTAADLITEQSRPTMEQRIRMEREYSKRWSQDFRGRIYTGKILQHILLHHKLASLSQQLVLKIPFVLPEIIKRTHGHPII